MDKKGKKQYSTQEKYEMDLMADTELSKLQRQYRYMEGDRKAFGGDTKNKIVRQRRVLKILQKEHQKINTDLVVANTVEKQAVDMQAFTQISKLLEQHDKVKADADKTKLTIGDLDEQIKKMEKQVGGLRCKRITDANFLAKIRAGEQAVKRLENKLNTVIQQFCSILSRNQILREEIDLLLKERAQFNIVWEKLVNNLNLGKKFMLDLIEQATIAYDQREEWCTKLQGLRIRAQGDLIEHTQEMRELKRRVDYDTILYEFLGIKGQKRVMKDLKEKEAKKREMLREKLAQELKGYSDTMNKIKELTGEQSIAKLAAQFIKQDEENFALFNYVNELHHEIESLNESIAKLYENIDEQRCLNEERAMQQKETIESLKHDLKTVTKEADHAEKKMNDEQTELSEILKGIGVLFTLAKCDNAPILDLLGEDSNISNYNVMLYLGLLQKKVTKMITNVYFHEKQDRTRPKIIKEKKPKPTHPVVSSTSPCPLCFIKEPALVPFPMPILDRKDVEKCLKSHLEQPTFESVQHNVSDCNMPAAREIIQNRYLWS